jgi:hypothetical protein
MLHRDEIIKALKNSLPQHDVIRAAWLGGADANGRADELSDVDVSLIVADGAIEAAFEAFRAAVKSLSPIRLEYRLPMPTWHGFHQTFVQLANASDHLMIDLVAMEKSQPHPWFEVERHGTPIVLFDKDGVIVSQHVDRDAIRKTIRTSLEKLRMRWALFHHLPAKLAKRNLPADAAYFYHALVLRPLVDVLRAVHCPDRHDFGFRYVKDDLPPDLYETICRLSYPKSVAEISAFVDEAKILLERKLEVAEQILNA